MKTIHRVSPIERFPVKARTDGRFQKRINGKLFYFGQDGDRKGALAEYERQKHDLYAGRRTSLTTDPDRLNTKSLANLFLVEKKAQSEAGVIKPGTLGDYKAALKRWLKFIGVDRVVGDLRPEDFAAYGRHLQSTAKLGPYACNKEKALVIAMFNYAKENRLAPPVWFGSQFKKASLSTTRGMKKRRLFTGAEIVKMINAAEPQLKAMILLGVNGGFGATDCSNLLWEDVDLKACQIHTIRHKRNILRDVPLWPETVAALEVMRSARPDDLHVFRKSDGKMWVQDKENANINAIVKVFVDFLKTIGITQVKGVAFNALRHVFGTYCNEIVDPDARRRIMGHKLTGMDDVYVDDIYWKRLKRVTDHVRSQIFTDQEKSLQSPLVAASTA